VLNRDKGSLVGSAFKNCKAAIRTSADFTNYQATTDVARGEGIVSSLALPLIIRNRTLGALGLGSRTENAFSHEDVDFLMRVAGQVAIAVENALAYREIAE
jgi:formate hydrogenlyase transcriptional activator